MNPTHPLDLFALAFLAGAGWTLGTSLLQAIAQHFNLWLIGRRQGKAAEGALARLKEGAAELEKAAASAEAAQQKMRAAAGTRERETFPVIAEVGRS